MKNNINNAAAKIKAFWIWAKPFLKAGLLNVARWAHAFWTRTKPVLRAGALTAARWTHTLLVWTCNWTRANWQAGRKGRIKVAIAGAVLMLLVGRIFFSGGDSSKALRASDQSANSYSGTDMTYEESEAESESRTESAIETISLQDYEPPESDADAYVERTHDCLSATASYACELHFQLRALPNGGYNYLVYRLIGNGEISLAVFNDADAFNAFLAYKQAVQKAREWIKIGRENNTTIDGFKDMGIAVPNGCAIKFPNAGDKWIAFDIVADIPNHKKAQTRFEFNFSENRRCLRLNCGGIYVDYNWRAEDDEKELAALESACDLVQLLRLFKGREGESSKLRMNQEYDEIPSVQNVSSRIPEWKCGDICTLDDFPGNLTVALSKHEDDPYNYTFSPHRVNDRFGRVPHAHLLIFPCNSYSSAYRAIERAFRIALAWRDVAKERCMLNLVKEIEIPCPNSVSAEIIGMENFKNKKQWWEALDKRYQPSSGKRTRFWFSVETEPNSEGDGKYAYKSEDTKFYLYFGNKDAIKTLKLDDQTIAAFRFLNPQLALEKFQGKAEAEKIFH